MFVYLFYVKIVHFLHFLLRTAHVVTYFLVPPNVHPIYSLPSLLQLNFLHVGFYFVKSFLSLQLPSLHHLRMSRPLSHFYRCDDFCCNFLLLTSSKPWVVLCPSMWGSLLHWNVKYMLCKGMYVFSAFSAVRFLFMVSTTFFFVTPIKECISFIAVSVGSSINFLCSFPSAALHCIRKYAPVRYIRHYVYHPMECNGSTWRSVLGCSLLSHHLIPPVIHKRRLHG